VWNFSDFLWTLLVYVHNMCTTSPQCEFDELINLILGKEIKVAKVRCHVDLGSLQNECRNLRSSHLIPPFSIAFRPFGSWDEKHEHTSWFELLLRSLIHKKLWASQNIGHKRQLGYRLLHASYMYAYKNSGPLYGLGPRQSHSCPCL
jgi:hypothetical protein